MNQRVRVLAIVAMLSTGSCSGAVGSERAAQDDTAARSTSVAQSPHDATIASLQAQLAVANADIDEFFGAPPFGEMEHKIIAIARTEWDERLKSCDDNACRAGILTDELNRALYALGRYDGPMQRLPWSRGALYIRRGNESGFLHIYPVIDDRLLVFAMTSPPHVRWLCEVTAEGRMEPSGAIDMRSLDDLRIFYRIQRTGDGTLTISTERPLNHACGLNGNIEGEYQVRETSVRPQAGAD